MNKIPAITQEPLTVVIDKGMNSPGNYTWIDEHSRVHFVTTHFPTSPKSLPQAPWSASSPLTLRRTGAF
jgi:hypothetical protein